MILAVKWPISIKIAALKNDWHIRRYLLNNWIGWVGVVNIVLCMKVGQASII